MNRRKKIIVGNIVGIPQCLLFFVIEGQGYVFSIQNVRYRNFLMLFK